MARLYRYVGPPQVAARAAAAPSPRLHATSAAAVAAWVAAHPDRDAGGGVTVTFVVLPDGLWVADRHSEHVSCARGAAVLSAGEMTLSAAGRRPAAVEAVHVTNQSTGYCPEPASWPAVAAALDAAGIAHPGGFSAEMAFRRCPACAAINLVKDGWFACDVCGAGLPAGWNLGTG